MKNTKELKDGKWVEAEFLPLYKETTPLWKRVYLRIKYWNNDDKYEESLNWIPQKEVYSDEILKKRTNI